MWEGLRGMLQRQEHGLFSKEISYRLLFIDCITQQIKHTKTAAPKK